MRDRLAQAVAGACGCCRLDVGQDCSGPIYGSNGSIVGFNTPCVAPDDDDYRRVDVMLAVLREPDGAMVEAGATQPAMADGYVGKSAPFVWHAMIDAITSRRADQPPSQPNRPPLYR